MACVSCQVQQAHAFFLRVGLSHWHSGGDSRGYVWPWSSPCVYHATSLQLIQAHCSCNVADKIKSGQHGSNALVTAARVAHKEKYYQSTGRVNLEFSTKE